MRPPVWIQNGQDVIFSAPAECTPFGRLVDEVRDTVGSNQIAATVTSWALYRYI